MFVRSHDGGKRFTYHKVLWNGVDSGCFKFGDSFAEAPAGYLVTAGIQSIPFYFASGI